MTQLDQLRQKIAEMKCEYPHTSNDPTPPKKKPVRENAGPELQKLAGMLQMAGKGMGMAGKAMGFLPTGVGNVGGAVLGGIGGALTAPPGRRMAGAAAGATAGLPGAAGFIAPTLAGKALGV